jgi:hypothetical protein
MFYVLAGQFVGKIELSSSGLTHKTPTLAGIPIAIGIAVARYKS